jgi:predicted ATPase
MLSRFRVQNFLCLKDVTVNLEALTIFVGPNSSGKSAIFKAMGTLSRLMRFPVRGDLKGDFNVEPGITLDDAVWKGDTQLPISFQVWYEGNQTDNPDYLVELRRGYAGWSVTNERFKFDNRWIDTEKEGFSLPSNLLTPGKKWVTPSRATLPYQTFYHSRDPKFTDYLKPIQNIRDQIGAVRRYRPSPSDIASFIKSSTGAARLSRETEVDESGKGFPLALQNVWKADRTVFGIIEQELHKMHSHVNNIDFLVDWRGTGILYKTTRVAFGTPASLESDGVLLTSFLLWRLYTAGNNFKFCLEEPENGVHISSLTQRYDCLVNFLAGQGKNRGVQILVSTHSRDFLNAINSRTNIMNQTRIVEYDNEIGTSVHELKHYRQVNQLLDEMKDKLGDVWWSNRLERDR